MRLQKGRAPSEGDGAGRRHERRVHRHGRASGLPQEEELLALGNGNRLPSWLWRSTTKTQSTGRVVGRPGPFILDADGKIATSLESSHKLLWYHNTAHFLRRSRSACAFVQCVRPL